MLSSFQWFLQVLTEKGSCYTFNHPQRSLPSSLDTPLRQTTKGPGFGLQLVLDARTVRKSNFFGEK